MKNKTVFDDLTVFDALELTAFDEVDLPPEDKVLYSKELDELIKSEIKKAILSLPIGEIVNDLLDKQMESKKEIKSNVKNELLDVRGDFEKESRKLRDFLDTAIEGFRKKYDELKTDLLTVSKQQYQFGGFSPQVNDLNIGDPSTNGSWRIVKSGTSLVVQRLEAGAWVEKGSFLA